MCMGEAMRVMFLVLALALTDTAHAQYPGGWQYPPAYPPTGEYPPRPAVRSPPISQAMLQAHNAVRSQVGVPPLVWSDQLASVAQAWADYLLATNSFSHRPNNRYGENLYMITGGAASPSQIVHSWADEARGYDIRSNTCSGVCGHYTQIVWAKTRAVGCAVAADRFRQDWVCNYDPPGNYVGYRPY